MPIFSRFGADFFTVYADFSRFVRDINGEKKNISLSMSFFTVSFSRFGPSRENPAAGKYIPPPPMMGRISLKNAFWTRGGGISRGKHQKLAELNRKTSRKHNQTQRTTSKVSPEEAERGLSESLVICFNY